MHTSVVELTWANKGKRLLAREDGTYEWANRADYRVDETRLLHDIADPDDTKAPLGKVGACHPDRERAKDNLLIRGDALYAMNSLLRIPEFRDEYKGKVRLAYLDPPFRTGNVFEHYDDNLEQSIWLTMMRDRLHQVRDFLAPNGTVWVHLDDAESHYARVLLDEVFGRSNFVATIHWVRKDTRSNNARNFSPNTDQIHVYARDTRRLRIGLVDRSESMLAAYKNPDNDPRGPWRSGPLYAKGRGEERPHTFSNGVSYTPPLGQRFRFTRERLECLDNEGRIYFGPNGTAAPMQKQYLSEAKQGMVPTTNWHHSEVGSNRHSRLEQKALFPGVTLFDTPKPERLLQRIIHLATDPGDIVLDCFAGSGTTAAVAHKMGRRWVTVEWSRSTLATFTEPRLRMVVEGEQGGVSSDVGWAGGGSFRVLEVAPSVFVDDPDSGTVVLAPDALGDRLAESIAANMGFTYEVDSPFCGRRGRERLAVVDGWLDDEIARYIAELLGERETVRIVATGFSDTARDALKAVSGGSTLKTIPQDLRSVRVRAAELQQAMVDRRAWESEHASTVQPTLFSGLTAGDM